MTAAPAVRAAGLDRDEFAAWLRLLETPGLGRASARRLLAAFGAPQRVLAAGAGAWREVAGATAAAALARPAEVVDTRLQAALAWLDASPQHHVLALGDPLYPPRLLQTADPPLLLYVQGSLALLGADSLAIVGSRHATPQGLEDARAFARALGDAGLVVVSGLAQGIDGAAHAGALDSRAGTIAVVGTGLDTVYPKAHRALAARIAEHGALVSEYAPGTPALPENFPQRNRIIAGLSLGTLVVEAALRSGSLITARLASEAGREVFAIPGSIHAPQAKGCHALIQQGAKLVQEAADIVDELRGQRRPLAAPPAAEDTAPADADPLLDALGDTPATLDALQARCGWPTAALSARLLEMELDGAVARLPGGLFQRLHRG
ncbi:DNA-processing protein DprA [Rubrivivax sp. RP6-9]|uniref:DNA-processing protein DprA n=1 Tax=Rubrivivax sp. RP6-9 TaxID=3415750 RepID=UPI003CC5DE16